jgi:hypothetical protein
MLLGKQRPQQRPGHPRWISAIEFAAVTLVTLFFDLSFRPHAQSSFATWWLHAGLEEFNGALARRSLRAMAATLPKILQI